MKNFMITNDQIARIACALTSDELARNFNVYTDFLTQSAWGAKTSIGQEGLKLTQEQSQACALRLCRHFDRADDLIAPSLSDCFGDWASVVADDINHSLLQFRFIAAGQSGSAESFHMADEIWQDARVISSLLHGRRRVISMVAPHSLFGFVTTVLAPNLQEIPVIDARNMTPDILAETLSFGDMLVATPSLWRYLIETLPKLANNVVGVSFGEPMTHSLADKLRKMGVGAMRELYGSTETGIIAWRDSPAEPFVLFEHWKREGDAIQRLKPDGNIRLVTAMDQLEWSGERSFALKGRLDGAVQIGAKNVYPDKIASVIAEHPDIEACKVRVGTQGDALDRLTAHIVLREKVAPDEVMAWKVDAWCQKKLRPPERPRVYNFEANAERL